MPRRVLDNAPRVEKPPDFQDKDFLRSLDDPLHRFVSAKKPEPEPRATPLPQRLIGYRRGLSGQSGRHVAHRRAKLCSATPCWLLG
jgi:hypothetical protein